ncbi:MAG: DEAD/DEAH box helicase [Gemmatimonadales bacterium]
MSSNHGTKFDALALHTSLVRGVDAAGFTSPRPIQAAAIPAGLEGRDVLGLAQTGTGKTAAFALPLLNRLLTGDAAGRGGSGSGPRALVLAPTRELARQIAEEIRMLAKFTRVKVVTIYGGVSAHGQIQALRKRPDVIVGCPGRVLDLLGQRELKLGAVETFVLDEADHMFDMGFLPDIRRIIGALPRRRQNLLFSATMPRDIRRLADDLLHRPHVVEMSDDTPAETIDHGLYHVAEGGKRALLEHLLHGADSAIVFTRTKRRAKRLARQLEAAGHRAVGLQGNMSQNARDRAMKGFRSRRYDVLVATDIASRGIDVNEVAHVINYDVPNTPETYTHRIGRTGRSENEGVASTFVTSGDAAWVTATERMIGEAIPRRQADGLTTAGNGNGNGKRRDAGNGKSRRNGNRRQAASGSRKRAAKGAVSQEVAPAERPRSRLRRRGPKRGGR